MKSCPHCAEQIQDAAVICRFCNRDVAVKAAAAATPRPTNQPVSSSRASSTTRKTRVVALGAIASALIVVAVIVGSADSTPDYTVSQAGTASAPRPSRVVNVADKEDVVVPGMEFKGWTWEATADQPSCRLTGHLEVLEGGNRDVVVYVATEDEYKNLSNGHKAMVNFQTDKVTAVTLDVPIQGTGRYVLMISNTFSAVTAKRVRAEDVKVTCQ